MSDDGIPDFGIKIRSVEITPAVGRHATVKLLRTRTEVQNGVTVTIETCRRADGSTYERTLLPDGSPRSWCEL